MDALKSLKKNQKKNLKNLVHSTEEILRTIIEDISKFKESLPSNFDQSVPTGYFYGFLYQSLAVGLDTEKYLQKQIKKSLKSIFGKKDGNLLYDYSMLKKHESIFKYGFDLSSKDLKLLSNYEEPINIIKYYSGKINANSG